MGWRIRGAVGAGGSLSLEDGHGMDTADAFRQVVGHFSSDINAVLFCHTCSSLNRLLIHLVPSKQVQRLKL
jgi:hypothetical protein